MQPPFSLFDRLLGQLCRAFGRDMFGAQAQHVPSTGATCTEQTRNVLRAKAVKKRLFHAAGLAVMKDLRTFAN